MKNILKWISVILFMTSCIITIIFGLYTQYCNLTLNNMGLWLTYWREYFCIGLCDLVLAKISYELWSR